MVLFNYFNALIVSRLCSLLVFVDHLFFGNLAKFVQILKYIRIQYNFAFKGTSKLNRTNKREECKGNT